MDAPNLPRQTNGTAKLEGVTFRRVLAVVDLSPSAIETLRYAMAVANKFDARISVLHVVELRLAPIGITVPSTGIIQTLGEAERQQLEKLVGTLWKIEMETTVAIRQGRPEEVIVHEARSIGASLIIMTVPKRGWLSRLLRPNTVKHVIQNSPCPIMLLQIGMTSETRVFTLQRSRARSFGGLTQTQSSPGRA
jgi:nucleotide-binding universal stress UspA family protein